MHPPLASNLIAYGNGISAFGGVNLPKINLVEIGHLITGALAAPQPLISQIVPCCLGLTSVRYLFSPFYACPDPRRSSVARHLDALREATAAPKLTARGHNLRRVLIRSQLEDAAISSAATRLGAASSSE